MLKILVSLLLLAWMAFPSLAARDVWTGVGRIVAIGDLHGDYGQFMTLLQQTRLVNKDGRWTGGKTHLVQVGDVPDRGPDTRKILDLLMRLQKQAKKSGGYVHALIGNHDAMNVYGDLRYVTPEEFAAFRTPNSERVRDAYYKQDVEWLKQHTPKEKRPTFDAAYKKKWYAEHPLGWVEHRQAYGPNGKYGKWIRRHNTVIRVNDTLFLHAGISARFAAMPIREINDRVRKELNDPRLLTPDGIVRASDGPLWYRGMARGNEQELAPLVKTVLANFQVKRIVIGHSPTAGTVIPRFGGRVLVIDVGLSKVYGHRLACLVIENDHPYTLHRGKRLELPGDSREALLNYLKQAAALDPRPSPLEPLIKRLSAAPAPAVTQ